MALSETLFGVAVLLGVLTFWLRLAVIRRQSRLASPVDELALRRARRGDVMVTGASSVHYYVNGAYIGGGVSGFSGVSGVSGGGGGGGGGAGGTVYVVPAGVSYLKLTALGGNGGGGSGVTFARPDADGLVAHANYSRGQS